MLGTRGTVPAGGYLDCATCSGAAFDTGAASGRGTAVSKAAPEQVAQE